MPDVRRWTRLAIAGLVALVPLIGSLGAGQDDRAQQEKKAPPKTAPKSKAKAKTKKAQAKEKTPPLPELNRKVVEYVREHDGQVVGNGMCATLAAEALAHAGAELDPGEGSTADYKWGDLIATFTAGQRPRVAILPGDVLQFRDAKTTTTRRTSSAIFFESTTYPHHTAVVVEVAPSGRIVNVLHQNYDPPKGPRKPGVVPGTVRLDDLKEGTIWLYRPRLKPEDRAEPAKRDG